MTLGYSRKSVRLLTFRSSSRIWAELHEKAFRRLGGAPRIIVVDFVPGNKILHDKLGHARIEFQALDVAIDPVRECLTECGVGKGEGAGTEHSYEQVCRHSFARVAIVNRNGVAGPIHKHLFASAVILA